MHKQVTITDIAKKLNISKSTVSRALNSAPEINEVTKQAVLKMARAMNYQPNLIAQSLRKSETHIIGVVVPEISIHFFSSAISGVQDKAAEHGYHVMICQSNEDSELEKSALQNFLLTRVDGLLISMTRETVDHDYFKEIMGLGVPIILFDRVIEELPVSQVTVDDYDGAFKVVSHLYDNGCRRIAHLAGPATLNISVNRKRGYQDALKSFHLERSEELVVSCPALRRSARAATEKILKLDPIPDAIFAVNDPVAIEASKVIKEHGLKIPEDIALAGFTNEPIGEALSPSLTTVAQPAYEIGQVAMELLLKQINSAGVFKPLKRVLKTTLLQRNSTRKDPQTKAIS